MKILIIANIMVMMVNIVLNQSIKKVCLLDKLNANTTRRKVKQYLKTISPNINYSRLKTLQVFFAHVLTGFVTTPPTHGACRWSTHSTG